MPYTDPSILPILNDRPALERTLLALRKAARERDANGRRNFAHSLPYRPHFVRGILERRKALRTGSDATEGTAK